MNMKNFADKYAADALPVDALISRWRKRALEADIDHLFAIGALTADGFTGDGLSDRISPELQEAMSTLLNDVESYGDSRALLRDFLTKDEKSIEGLINKIKGQVGENRFLEACGSKAELASSGSQEGWDIAIDHGNVIEYVQVKTYTNPNDVIRKMLEVHEKVESGQILHGDAVVNHINFAVPYDIRDAVSEKMSNYPELAGIEVLSINITAAEAAEIVGEGLDNLGPEALSHLFGELMGGTLTAAAIHSLLSSIRVLRGQMEIGDAAAQALGNTAISAAGYATGLAVEVALDTALDSLLGAVSVGSSIAVRVVLKKAAKGRLNTYQSLHLNNQILRSRIEHFATI